MGGHIVAYFNVISQHATRVGLPFENSTRDVPNVETGKLFVTVVNFSLSPLSLFIYVLFVSLSVSHASPSPLKDYFPEEYHLLGCNDV
jgi:hypothetical protein